MLEFYRQLAVRKDHAIVIPQSCCPGKWFCAGEAVLAPLYRKRSLYLERSKLVHAWTIYTAQMEADQWLVPPKENLALHFPLKIRSRDPSGWILTIPPEIRDRSWLPRGPATVMFEYSDNEANLWLESAYNEEALLEADAS